MADSQKETVLVTGGAGCAGSHTVITLLEDGYNVVVIDSFSNGCPSKWTESINRIEALRGTSMPCYDVDLCNKNALLDVFSKHPEISVVIHFAALKAVGESVENQLEFYRVNIQGTLNLIEAMMEKRVTDIIFSRSATVYGDPVLPMDEKHHAQFHHFMADYLSYISSIGKNSVNLPTVFLIDVCCQKLSCLLRSVKIKLQEHQQQLENAGVDCDIL